MERKVCQMIQMVGQAQIGLLRFSEAGVAFQRRRSSMDRVMDRSFDVSLSCNLQQQYVCSSH
jgi:hypothetical protein